MIKLEHKKDSDQLATPLQELSGRNWTLSILVISSAKENHIKIKSRILKQKINNFIYWQFKANFRFDYVIHFVSTCL